MGLCLIVHQGGVLLEEPVILPADGLLEQMDGLWIIEVVLPTGSGLVLPQALQCQVPTRETVLVKYLSITSCRMPTASKIWADW